MNGRFAQQFLTQDVMISCYISTTILITNQKLTQQELTQLGRQVHASMARAIQPFHTLFMGH